MFVLYDGTESPPLPLNPRSAHPTHEVAQDYINHLRDAIHLGNDGMYHVNQYFSGTQQDCIDFVNNIQIFDESESESESESDQEDPTSVLDFDKVVRPMSLHIGNMRINS